VGLVTLFCRPNDDDAVLTKTISLIGFIQVQDSIMLGAQNESPFVAFFTRRSVIFHTDLAAE
jgi:hypothetical protein